MSKASLLDFNNIAIIQTAFLGDVVLTLYLAQAIKDFHHTSVLTFVTTPLGSTVASVSKAIDNIITYDKKGLQKGFDGIKRVSQMLQERNIECIIAPHRSLRTSVLTFLSNPKFSVGFNKNAFSILYSRRIKYLKHYHEIERNLSLLNAFNIKEPGSYSSIIIDLDIHEADKTYVETKLKFNNLEENRKLIAIAPGSVWLTKKWLEEYFIEVINKFNELDFNAILLGSQQDFDVCQRISNKTNSINFSGEMTIPQVIHLLTKTQLLITNDSAPTHLAGLVKCPTLTIYGPTSPIFGFYPRGQFDKSVEIDSLKCKPCAIHGSNECPMKTHSCMKDLKPEIVFNNAIEILNNIKNFSKKEIE